MTQHIALVTGGGRESGKNAALTLAAKGTDIILTWHSNQQAALKVMAEIEQKGVKAAVLSLNIGDVGSFDGFAQKVAELLQRRWQRHTFDCLLNNSGVGLNAAFAQPGEALFDELMSAQRVEVSGGMFLLAPP